MATNTGICPKCSQINSYSATHCIECGNELPWSAVAAQAKATKQAAQPSFSQAVQQAQGAPSTLQAPPPAAPAPQSPPPDAWAVFVSACQRELAGLFICVGGYMAIHFAFFFDTTVKVDGGFLGISRVNNIWLMQQQQNGIVIGMGLVILGTIMYFALKPGLKS